MRPIDADAIQFENSEFDTYSDYSRAFDAIDYAPTIKTFTLADIEENYRKGLEKGLEERPHGEWIKFTLESGFLSSHKCSNCGFNGNQLWHFCPNCGADMRKMVLDQDIDGAGNDGNVKEGEFK